jgi:hypothetical protein
MFGCTVVLPARDMKLESEIRAYLQTPAGSLARYRLRRRKQVLLIVEGVEPLS